MKKIVALVMIFSIFFAVPAMTSAEGNIYIYAEGGESAEQTDPDGNTDGDRLKDITIRITVDGKVPEDNIEFTLTDDKGKKYSAAAEDGKLKFRNIPTGKVYTFTGDIKGFKPVMLRIDDDFPDECSIAASAGGTYDDADDNMQSDNEAFNLDNQEGTAAGGAGYQNVQTGDSGAGMMIVIFIAALLCTAALYKAERGGRSDEEKM